MNSLKICCLIITYNPEDFLFELINTLENQVDKILIVDNNSSLDTIEKVTQPIVGKNVELIRNNQNLGIATALNQGILRAKEMGYEWVVTFDQDSRPFTHIIKILNEVYFSYPDKAKIGAIGINFPIASGESYYPQSSDKKYSERDYLITSGCLMSIEAFSLVGNFRDDFFIDNVDLEYSLRLKKNGKISLITNEWGMKHSPGHPLIKRIFGKELMSTNHSSLRRYYMGRNHVILTKMYLMRYPYFIAKLNFFFCLSIFKILLIEQNKMDKIKASFKGILNGFSSKLCPQQNINGKK